MSSAIFSRRFAANYFSTLGFIGLSYRVIASKSGFHRSMLQGQWQFGMFEIDAVLTIHTLFLALIALYAVVLIPYYARYPWARSQGVRVCRAGTSIEPGAPVRATLAGASRTAGTSESGACRSRPVCRRPPNKPASRCC